jgi:CDP-2,3-bis-(O-geranylgeranyl)-sn-glycerol synthase
VADYLFLFLQVLYLLAPLLVASAFAGVVQRFDLLSGLRRPIDGGRTYRGHRIFGDGKTWRGVVVAVVGCVATVALQKYVIGDRAGWLLLVDYDRIPVVPFGAAMGAGASLGELPNSFVKRQLGIAQGKATSGPLALLFFVWDQIDLLITAWPLIWYWVQPSAAVVVMSFVVGLVVHPTVSLIGYLVRARKSAR